MLQNILNDINDIEQEIDEVKPDDEFDGGDMAAKQLKKLKAEGKL